MQMLDTIVLSLNQTEFQITDMEKFSPSAHGIYRNPYYSLGARGYISCYQNPSKTELEQKIYKPRLTLTKRKAHVGYAITLRCEFSAPKLLFGNNFDELRETNFEIILDILQSKLASMGVRVKKAVLRKAQVSAIHFSKNIPLTDYSTCSMVLAELGKINLTQRLDLSHTDYRNEGYVIRYHSNSYEIAFYDKIKDMRQARTSEKRAMERDYFVQADLFNRDAYIKPLEVLRMEIRVGNRTKMKALFATLGINTPLEFDRLFKQAISQAVLLHFWNKITQDMPLLALSSFKPEDIYYALVAESKKKAKPAKTMQMVGSLVLIHSVGMRGLHSLVSSHSNSRTWQRMKKELESIDMVNRMKYQVMGNIQRCLERFEPLCLSAFQISDKTAKRL
jgi:hypothetical protein